MRGGYRYGAGRPGWNGKVESLLDIDVRQWSAKKMLIPGSWNSWNWYKAGEKIASIGVRGNNNSVILDYSWTPHGEPSQDISKEIKLIYTTCHFGGRRAWFVCPTCRQRVAKLYVVKEHWYCRKSLNVAYSSQSLDVMGRLHRKIAKLESKIGNDGKKPKGMHWSTYRHLQEKRDNVELKLDLVFFKKVQWML